MTIDLHGRHFLKEVDFSVPEWEYLLDLTGELKRARRERREVQRLGGMLALPWRGGAPGSALTKGVRRRTGPAPDARRPAETAAAKEGSDQGL